MHTSISLLAALAATAAAKNIVITVGADGLVFSPDSPTADIGDVLEFQFVSSIHTVVQGDFSTPCAQGSLSSTGFDSGPVTSVC
jgi:plastocyanin